MTRAPFTALLALLLAGCAATAPVPEDAKLPWLDDYARDPFVPVNLFVNANQHVGEERGRLLDYAASQLQDSGAFLRVDRGTQRWLYSLQLEFQPGPPGDGHGSSRLLSVVTLGLVPVGVPESETLVAEVFHEPEPAAKFDFVQPYRDTASWFHVGNGDDAKAAIDLLLRRLMAQVSASRAIPRAREFDEALEEKPPAKKKPPKPKGTPT